MKSPCSGTGATAEEVLVSLGLLLRSRRHREAPLPQGKSHPEAILLKGEEDEYFCFQADLRP